MHFHWRPQLILVREHSCTYACLCTLTRHDVRYCELHTTSFRPCLALLPGSLLFLGGRPWIVQRVVFPCSVRPYFPDYVDLPKAGLVTKEQLVFSFVVAVELSTSTLGAWRASPCEVRSFWGLSCS